MMFSISGKSFVSPQVAFEELNEAKVAGNEERCQVTPPVKSLFTDDRK
jgi:hypothetical protein